MNMQQVEWKECINKKMGKRRSKGLLFYYSFTTKNKNDCFLFFCEDCKSEHENKFSHLYGEELKDAIKKEIRNKEKDLKGQNVSLGTTPRRLTDLIGSLADLTSGSGDKGTPVVFIQGYFDNLADE